MWILQWMLHCSNDLSRCTSIHSNDAKLILSIDDHVACFVEDSKKIWDSLSKRSISNAEVNLNSRSWFRTLEILSLESYSTYRLNTELLMMEILHWRSSVPNLPFTFMVNSRQRLLKFIERKAFNWRLSDLSRSRRHYHWQMKTTVFRMRKIGRDSLRELLC